MLKLATIETGPIIIGVIALILFCLALYYIVRMMKGKVEIELPKRGYNSGEEISGAVTLTSRKELKMNRFFVALIGYERIERYDSDGNRKTRRKEIYRYEHNLTEAGALRAGNNQRFEFTIVAPGSQKSADSSELSGQIAGAIKTTANVISAMSGTSRRLEWKLEARADLPGVDLASSKKLRVNYI
ncbi:MAG: hypothetical protein QNK82_05855 [Akkermansiaceae bacterium]|jgi:hypothetical protein